jgi:hypothetical protein
MSAKIFSGGALMLTARWNAERVGSGKGNDENNNK